MKFREFVTSSEKIILAGKNAENNEELVAQVGKEEIVMHTAEPGSPFVNIKGDSKKVSKKDLNEAATFCASKSQDWRDNKSDVEVHYFYGKDVYKNKGMEKGTFGVKKFKVIKIKKKEIERFLEDR
jgi:predicted ribosome quality control (RQC) complex YloA/Tae2 family protein